MKKQSIPPLKPWQEINQAIGGLKSFIQSRKYFIVVNGKQYHRANTRVQLERAKAAIIQMGNSPETLEAIARINAAIRDIRCNLVVQGDEEPSEFLLTSLIERASGFLSDHDKPLTDSMHRLCAAWELGSDVNAAPPQESTEWVKITDAARRIETKTEGIWNFNTAKSKLSAGCTNGTLRSNGKKGPDRRVALSDVDALILKHRDGALESEDSH